MIGVSLIVAIAVFCFPLLAGAENVMKDPVFRLVSGCGVMSFADALSFVGGGIAMPGEELPDSKQRECVDYAHYFCRVAEDSLRMNNGIPLMKDLATMECAMDWALQRELAVIRKDLSAPDPKVFYANWQEGHPEGLEGVVSLLDYTRAQRKVLERWLRENP